MKKILESFDRMMMAITFAEAGCPETAQKYLAKTTKTQKTQKTPLNDFLCAVGLDGVRAHYGTVSL